MEWTRKDLKTKAKLSLKANYWKSVLVAFVLMVLSGGLYTGSSDTGSEDATFDVNNFIDSVSGRMTEQTQRLIGLGLVIIAVALVLGLLIDIFLLNPLKLGCKKYFLDASEGRAELYNMGFGFKSWYMNIVAVQFLTNLYIFLWSLLLFIPGIIKSYSYRMIPYIISENPEMSFTEAKDLSREMMNGQKWRTFVLDLSFILWGLLAALTFNIAGILWVEPYMQFTDAKLYLALCGRGDSSAVVEDVIEADYSEY